MSSNPALYRYIQYIGGNILDASNVTLLQTILEGRSAQTVNLLPSLAQLYQQGTLLNGTFVISGSSIVFQHANTNFPVFALINDQFESLGNTVTINGSQPVSGSSVPLFLNWSWDIVTYTSDSTFTDGTTGQPTIEAGQLSFDVDWVDTSINGDSSVPSSNAPTNSSGIPLDNSTQFAKNLNPIVLAYFNLNATPNVTVTYINGAFPYAFGNPTQAGLVSLTDTSGLAVGNTDPRNSNARDPIPASVYNSSVAALIQTGTNSTTLPAWLPGDNYTPGQQIVDSNGNVETVVSILGTGTSGGSAPTWNLSLGGTTFDNPGADQVTWVNGGPASTDKYDPATPSQGGIFTDSIIYTTLKEKLTTFLDAVNTNIENTLIALTNHIGKPLGTSETHPFPTAFQVGAAPASHVGQVLGLGTSHPATVNSDTGGFVVDEITSSVSGDAFALYDDSSTLKAALTHSGDVYSLLANAFNAQGGNGGGGGGTATNKGTLGLMSLIAAVLAEHVNYTAAGVNVRNNNPHGLVSADIGAASESYVNTQISDIISDVTSYTDAKTNISVRSSTITGSTHVPSYGHWPSNAIPNAYTQETMTYLIFNIGGSFELALGTGILYSGDQIPLPESSGWSGSSSNFLANAAVTESYTYTGDSGIGTYIYCNYNPSTRIVTMSALTDGGSSNRAIATVFGWATTYAVGWRSITAAPIIISSFDNTSSTFNSGTVGDTVTILGRNFGSVRGGSTVSFNGTPVVSYSAWSSTSLVVVIPSGATTGVLTVVVSPNTVTSPFVFTVS